MLDVLVLEDDPNVASQLVRHLASRGVQLVAVAATVAEALKLLDPPPYWVILDMNLPDGSGLEVLHAIRQAKLPTRVIVSSSTTNDGVVAAFTAYNPELILPKPLDPTMLPF